jgi:type II secretory pathway pseudopilin PulG
MKSKTRKTGFSIIELLTVMSIIIVLLGILVPALGAVRRYAKVVRQKGMFHDISKGLEMFSVDFEGYPDSSAGDGPSNGNNHYCGAMKLCEAMVGQDGLGFHPDSVFNDEEDTLYFNWPSNPLPDPLPAGSPEEQNLRDRKPKYLEGEDVQIAPIEYLGDSLFDPCCPVLCDVFKRNQLTTRGEKAGMPILYYRADTSKIRHHIDELGSEYDSGLNIYNYWDNAEVIRIDMIWSTEDHPFEVPPFGQEGRLFYEDIIDESVPTMDKPHKPDGYILISAGWDGLYGTDDDVYNFD